MLTSGAFGYLLDYLIWWMLLISIVVHTSCFFRFYPRTRRTSRLILGNMLVFLCFLGGAGMVGETYFRFLAVQTDSFGMSLPARRWFTLHTTLNTLGCRDKEWSAKKPNGVRRIVFLGDSFTYGWGVEDPALRFSDLIQARFRTVGAPVEVMNVAKPGWGTGDEVQPLMDMVEVFHADEIVLCHVPNDIERLLPRSDDFDPIRPPAPTWLNLDSSPLLDFLYRRIYLPRVPTVRHYHDWLAEGYSDPIIWKKQCDLFDRMVELCRERGVILRVALLPFLRTQGTKFDQVKIHSQIREYFEGQKVPVVDLLPEIQGQSAQQLVVNSMDPHPNEEAHAIFAKAIMRAFWPNLASQDH